METLFKRFCNAALQHQHNCLLLLFLPRRWCYMFECVFVHSNFKQNYSRKNHFPLYATILYSFWLLANCFACNYYTNIITPPLNRRRFMIFSSILIYSILLFIFTKYKPRYIFFLTLAFHRSNILLLWLTTKSFNRMHW